MKNELPYFEINGSYGSNQNWFIDLTMYMGGCAAVTACDSCIYLALYKGKKELYPYDSLKLCRKDYVRFSKKMKPYLRPRREGIKTLDVFIEGFQKYIRDFAKMQIKMTGFSGKLPVEDAERTIQMQIENGMPIPFLLLKHTNPNLKDFTWHWFLIAGYEVINNEFFVKIITYGKYHWFLLDELWNTGYEEKGGMIILDIGK